MNCDTKGSSMGDHADWKDLAGRQVHVQKEGRTIRTGYVEDVAVTADALWLEAYGVERIYHPNDGMHMGLVAMI